MTRWSRPIIDRWATSPRRSGLRFGWLNLARPERLIDLARRFPNEARAQCQPAAPCLASALSGASEALREALDAEVRAEQAKDRAYWAPLKTELEAFRRAERQGT